MKPDEVIYVKVLIKSEKDLPEKEGEYWFWVKERPKELDYIHFNPDDSDDVVGSIYYDYYLRPTSLRDVLKDFNSFMCGKRYDGRIPLIDTCIDEYINSKK